MALDKQTLKTQLLNQYAAQLDKLLAQVEGNDGLHLTDIEELALKLRREVGREVTAALADHESKQQAVDVACAACQQLMRYKGRKSRWLKTRSGDVQVERPYYYCEPCQRGYFPPG